MGSHVSESGNDTDMTSDAQINANRRNALLSTGPSSPAGCAKSAQNSRRHGMRAEQENLGRDETIAFETRYMRWASNYGVETDSEEFLRHANLFLSFDMDRAKRAYFERAQSAIDQAVQVEIEEVRDTGNQLFFDPRGLPIHKEKARQSLVDMVQTEIERIRAIAQEHKQNAGEEAARIRALKAFDISPTAETIRKSFIRAKSSVERGIAVIRKETKARKADSDGQGLPPVPGKDISPYDGRPAAWWRERRGVQDGGRRAEDGGRRTRISAEGEVRRPALNMWVSVGAAGHLRMVARTRALKLAVRLGRTAQGVCLLLRMRSAAGGIRLWLRNRMFLRVGGICLRGTSVVRAMATARPSQQVLIRGAMKGLPGTAMRYKSLKNRRTKPICVMTYSQHNMKKLLRFRRIPAVFRDLTVVKRTQFFWRRSQFRRGVWRGVELVVRRRRNHDR